MGPLPQPHHVCTETISTELRLRTPYRGVETGRATLRIRVLVAPRHQAPHEVVIDVDDLAVEVRSPSTGAQGGLGQGGLGQGGLDQGCLGQGCLVLGAGAIDALFVVERQPPRGFLTWFGVFARRRGRADRLVLETPEPRVARYVERTIEDRLGLDDEPVRGELRVLL